MPHLYAETLLSPGLGGAFLWRYQNDGRELLSILDRESPVYGALGQAIARFENTVFELSLNKPSLIEWANSQENLQDAADQRELRLGGAHVFQQSIELFQSMQMMTDREDDPVRLSAIHHNIGDVMGFIGQRSGSVHFLEQASMSYEQALELRTAENTPLEWAQTSYNLALVMQNIGQLENDKSLLKQSLAGFKLAVNFLPRATVPDEWAAGLCSSGVVLYLLGTRRRGARTLEQSVVAFRNVLSERTLDKNKVSWAITQNNLAAAMQGLGEHEEDIASLEASIPVYDSALKVLDGELAYPLVVAMVAANRASAMLALATESDYLDMAEATVVEFEKLCQLFEGTDYVQYQTSALARKNEAEALVASLQV